MATIKERVEREGLCPECGGLGVYAYTIEAPIDPVDGGGAPLARVSYEFKCMVCGYEESKRVLMPLKALYILRYLLDARARGAVERAKLIADVRERLARRGRA